MNRTDNGTVGLLPLIIAVLIVIGGCVATIAAPMIREARQKAVIQRRVDEYMAAQEEERKNATPRPTPAPTTDPSTYKIPVVGMAEENINKTQYSRTFRFDHDFTSYDKSRGGMVNKRYYYDGRGTRSDPAYYIVICADGYVDQILDHRYDPVTYMPEGGLTYKRNSSNSKKSDPYGDAEEFYYQNRDEFDDFDEAEEYYNDHYGK